MVQLFIMWLVGLLTGISAFKIYLLVQEQKISLKWYHGILGLIWYLLGIFIVAFVGTSFAEGEPQAAVMAFLIFGGSFLVISILLYRFVFKKSTISPLTKSEAAA